MRAVGSIRGLRAAVVQCAEGDAVAGMCPGGSKIGDVTVGVSAGTSPFYITNGRAYVTGPAQGCVVRALDRRAGGGRPFDLGNVGVRSALFVDKHDAGLRVVSDPLPTILQGIPLDVRDVRVGVDEPHSFVNPTNDR